MTLLLQKSRGAVIFLLLVVLPHTSRAEAGGGRITEPPQVFVQKFYDWYVPRTLKSNAAPAWVSALKDGRFFFDPKLALALKVDAAAQAREQGDIVGIDFDPFLASQDPKHKYSAGGITQKRETYWVDVYGVPGRKDRKPDVIAEVERAQGRWTFVNFHYLENGNLLTILGLLREDRAKAALPNR